MAVLVIQLSDIHIKTRSDQVLRNPELIASAVYAELVHVEAVVIALTGDIAFSGEDQQYDLATNFLNSIVSHLRSEKNIPIHIVACAGNHDCDFAKGRPAVRRAVIENIRPDSVDETSLDEIAECTSIQVSFENFRSSIQTATPTYKDELWATYQVSATGRDLIFHCLNSAWQSQLREQHGALSFPIKRYEQELKSSDTISIVMLHHPFSWFSPVNYRDLRSMLRRNANLVLTGHEHEQRAASILATDSGESVAIDGAVLQGGKGDQTGFNTIRIDTEGEQYCITFYKSVSNGYIAQEMESPWSSFRKIPKKVTSEFNIEADYQQWLDDAGAPFVRQGKSSELHADDVYVFPELRSVDDQDDGRTVISADTMRSPESLNGGVLISGQDQYGKTAFLKQLFRDYYARGYVPLIMNGAELRKSTTTEIQKSINSAVRRAYGSSAEEKYWKAGKASRILLLDDLDDSPLSGEYLSNAVSAINDTFEFVCVTASELFELRELISSDGKDAFGGYKRFRLLEFGYRLRLALIRRWVSLGGQEQGLGLMVDAVDRAEKTINEVLGEGVVPSSPFFLLTLLQSIESGSTSNLHQSALGDYYKYLVIHSFECNKVGRDEHSEILNYCANLAWFIHGKSDHLISEVEFKSFHTSFVDKHFLNIDFNSRRQLLLRTKIIECSDGCYSFRYQYLFYYFLGMHLSRRLEDPEVQELVRESCKKLYDPNSANLILFLSHHSLDSRVYESIVAVLGDLYPTAQPMKLEGDANEINTLISEAPQMVFVDGDVFDKRAAARSHQDENERARRAVTRDPEKLPPEVMELIRLAKTIDILGQFLKNHYGQLEADVKSRLVREIFDGALRGTRQLVNILVENSEGLVSAIEGVLEKRGIEDNAIERSARAKREMFSLLSYIVFAYIKRGGVSIASPHLARVVDSVVDGDGSAAYKLMGLTALLERQGALDDLGSIKRMNQALSGNALACSVLQKIVLAHLHLFAYGVGQKQKICDELNIRLEAQQAREFMGRTSRRLQ